MLTESDMNLLKKVDSYIPEYIRLRMKILNAVDWSEEYKWKILPELNKKKLFDNLSVLNIKEAIKSLQDRNPKQGTFTRWNNIENLMKAANINPNKIVELIKDLVLIDSEIATRIRNFNEEYKKFWNDQNVNEPSSVPLSAFLLASYDCNKYAIYKDEIFQSLKNHIGAADWPTDLGGKYKKFLEICFYFGEKLNPQLKDREIRSVIVKGNNTVLNGQDFIFILNDILKPKRYWKIAPGENAFLWKENLKDKNIRLGWDTDVLKYKTREEFIEYYKSLCRSSLYDPTPNDTNKANEQWDFANMQEGDIVVANKGLSFILGIGKVKGPFSIESKYKEFKQSIPIQWIDKNTRKIPKNEKIVSGWGFRTVRELSKNEYNHLIDISTITDSWDGSVDTDAVIYKEESINPDLIDLWQEKKNIILYGSPGTSKTYNTEAYCKALLKRFDSDQSDENLEFLFKQQTEFITFHPSYQYEHFIEGLTIGGLEEGKPTDTIHYELKPGIFKNLCKRALGSLIGLSYEEVSSKSWKEVYQAYEEYISSDQTINEDHILPFILIIDEINRGDISKIFGELITLIEPSKRIGEESYLPAKLPISGDIFGVPPNLYIIGTMNTADRSIALIDVALRRRFGFISMMPDYGILEKNIREHKSILEDGLEELLNQSVAALQIINKRICESKSLGRDKQIGHTYLMGVRSKQQLLHAWRYSIYPLLEEYCYSNFEQISCILFGKEEAPNSIVENNDIKDDLKLNAFLDEINKKNG